MQEEPPVMRTRRVNPRLSERLDDRMLVRIVASRVKEVGVPVDIANLSSRLPQLDKAQRFARLNKAKARNVG